MTRGYPYFLQEWGYQAWNYADASPISLKVVRELADIADSLGAKITTLDPVRASLIRKGMVYGPSHGEIAFTVPLFDEFMRRATSEFEPR